MKSRSIAWILVCSLVIVAGWMGVLWLQKPAPHRHPVSSMTTCKERSCSFYFDSYVGQSRGGRQQTYVFYREEGPGEYSILVQVKGLQLVRESGMDEGAVQRLEELRESIASRYQLAARESSKMMVGKLDSWDVFEIVIPSIPLSGHAFEELKHQVVSDTVI